MTHVPRFLSSSELSRRLASDRPPVVIDVRRGPAFEADPLCLPGALRGPPDRIGMWSGDLPRDRSVVVYCVHGHEVSRGAAATLATSGFDVAVLEGGIAGWKGAGHSVIPLATPRPVGDGDAPTDRATV
jgi:rhodanese-related sulfurtransferase